MNSVYYHHVKYYETDQMKIVHHSNYIRWMEEARIDLMDKLGCGYVEMERRGIVSPVVEVRCRFVSMTRFDDTVAVVTRITGYSGARLSLSYTVTDSATGAVRATGESSHCFLDASGRPAPLKKLAPDFDAAFRREAANVAR